MPVCLAASMSWCQSVLMPVCLAASMSWCKYVLLPVCLAASMSCCQYVLLPVCIAASMSCCQYVWCQNQWCQSEWCTLQYQLSGIPGILERLSHPCAIGRRSLWHWRLCGGVYIVKWQKWSIGAGWETHTPLWRNGLVYTMAFSSISHQDLKYAWYLGTSVIIC